MEPEEETLEEEIPSEFIEADGGEDSEIEEDLEEEDEEEEEKEPKLFSTPVLDATVENPDKFIDSPDKKEIYENSKKIKDFFKNKDGKPAVHPGFVSTYSFGEHEFERLKFMLFRLDDVAEKVLTYRKDYMQYFPEFYATLKNLFINIYFIVDSTNRAKIEEGLNFVELAVIEYTTQKSEINTAAIQILGEIYLVLTNIKNFHGLGFSYEKKKGESERFEESFFKRRPR